MTKYDKLTWTIDCRNKTKYKTKHFFKPSHTLSTYCQQ